jgi:hypothetical protein
MLLSYHKNAVQNYDVKIANRSFENMSQFKYLGRIVTDQEEIKRRLNCCNIATVQSGTFCLVVCCLKNVMLRIYKTVVLSAILYECRTWSLTLRDKRRCMMCENRVLRRIFSSKGLSDKKAEETL